MVQKSGGNAPLEVGSSSHHLKGFLHPTGGCLGCLPSTVGLENAAWKTSLSF